MSAEGRAHKPLGNAAMKNKAPTKTSSRELIRRRLQILPAALTDTPPASGVGPMNNAAPTQADRLLPALLGNTVRRCDFPSTRATRQTGKFQR